MCGEKKLVEKGILGLENGWELIFDAIPDPIAIVDRDHRIVKMNKSFADKIGKFHDHMLGNVCYQTIDNLEDSPVNCPHTQLLKDGLEHSRKIYEKHLGGHFTINASPINDNEGNLIGSIYIAHDFTKRKEIEDELEKTLKEKDILMKEIYHRVKNNLMIISSLLSLQSRYIKDKDTKEIFRKSQNRAKSMALIHEKLYKSEDLKSINFAEYLKNLSNDLYTTYTTNQDLVKLFLDVDNIIFDIEISIPLGLILNELLTNSLKHAFPNNRKGEVKIELHKKNNGRYYLSVADNGIGLPKNLNPHKIDTLGMQLINSLTKQINGELTVNTDNGTEFIIKFNVED
ncbi:MAG: histidine kinase dimerization/phosphoacceptor domain -containing protein [Methanobacterium sp.]|nr:histidine kinase dimerization/phosphoacceptor domain -containing protein [Methanobacterium sp.]